LKRILFINPNTRDQGVQLSVYPPLGILYISSVLINEGYEVRVLDADFDNLTHQNILDFILRFSPEIIGITMNTLQYRSVLSTAKNIKRCYPEIKIVVGGPHPSTVKGELLERSASFDYVVYGEGEKTFLELIRAIENDNSLKSVNGICYRNDDAVETNKPRELLKNLDEIPFPSWDLVYPISRYPGPYPVGARPTIQVMASRGCPFLCSFCSNPVWGRSVRMRSPESILSEVEFLQKNYGVKEIFFQDDTFNINRQWFETICQGIIEKKLNDKIIFKTPFRANKNLVDYKMLKLAKTAGFWMIFYGVESGNQNILNGINKNLKLEEIERAFKLTKKADIRCLSAFMIGNLNETRETVKDTIKFAKKIDPDYYGFSIAMPYPGSEMYNQAKKSGLLKCDYEDYQINKYILKSKEFHDGEIEQFVDIAVNSVVENKNSFLYTLKNYIKGDFSFHQYQLLDYHPILKCPSIEILSTTIIMGNNELGVLGLGWYSLESWPEQIRWTGKKALAFLKKEPQSTKINFKIMSYFENLTFKISINGKRNIFHINTTDWRIYSVPLNGEKNKLCLEIVIEINKTWTPATHKFFNKDFRKLGVAVERIWIE
jgi:radical SAM superfamily enzyme YgiQ (UPF0313 family)